MVIPYSAALGALAEQVPIEAREGFEGLIWKFVTSGGAKLRRVPALIDASAASLLGPTHGRWIPGVKACRRRIYVA
eukprot:gene1343-22386_t